MKLRRQLAIVAVQCAIRGAVPGGGTFLPGLVHLWQAQSAVLNYGHRVVGIGTAAQGIRHWFSKPLSRAKWGSLLISG